MSSRPTSHHYLPENEQCATDNCVCPHSKRLPSVEEAGKLVVDIMAGYKESQSRPQTFQASFHDESTIQAVARISQRLSNESLPRPIMSTSEDGGDKRTSPSTTSLQKHKFNEESSGSSSMDERKEKYKEISSFLNGKNNRAHKKRRTDEEILEDSTKPDKVDALSTKADRRSIDVDHFFEPRVSMNMTSKGQKGYRACKICSMDRCEPQYLVADLTTLRRHLQSRHIGEYRKWVSDNNFVSKLPKDVKQRVVVKEQVTVASESQQTPPSTAPRSQYSAKRFREAAVEWLIATNQPLSALEHPKFRAMIQLAAASTEGVKLPPRETYKDAILRKF